jgi:ABC-type multidrug transport system ATPase subunit
LKPKKSEIYFDNQKITDTSTLNKYIGYCHEEVFSPQNLHVGNLVKIFFSDGQKQSDVFHAPRIKKMENQKVGTLSVGEQRYLQFLLLIYSNHHFLLLDEPFKTLEPLVKEFIQDVIKEHRNDKGFIVTDHYYRDVWEIASTKKLLKEGSMVPIVDDADLIKSGYLSR